MYPFINLVYGTKNLVKLTEFQRICGIYHPLYSDMQLEGESARLPILRQYWQANVFPFRSVTCLRLPPTIEDGFLCCKFVSYTIAVRSNILITNTRQLLHLLPRARNNNNCPKYFIDKLNEYYFFNYFRRFCDVGCDDRSYKSGENSQTT